MVQEIIGPLYWPDAPESFILWRGIFHFPVVAIGMLAVALFWSWLRIPVFSFFAYIFVIVGVVGFFQSFNGYNNLSEKEKDRAQAYWTYVKAEHTVKKINPNYELPDNKPLLW